LLETPALEPKYRTWRQRFAALRNVPLIVRLSWQASPALLLTSLAGRILGALLPLAGLWLAKLIVDLIVATTTQGVSASPRIWWLVAGELLVGVSGAVLAKTISYCESRLADEFSRGVSLRIMRHAMSLDLQSFEDPAFYDQLERARAQAGDRVWLLNALGNLVQQAATLVSFSVAVVVFSPPLFLLLFVSLIPAFIGETHFAFVGYSLAHEVTPLRRELDYIRLLATGRETAKETQLFSLEQFFLNRFASANGELIRKNRDLQGRRLVNGSLLSMVGVLGYYGTYAFVVWETLHGRLTIGSLMFMGGALNGTSGQLQSVFSILAGIADQALLIGDLRDFFNVKPTIRVPRAGLPLPRPIRSGVEFRNVSFHYPGSSRLVLDGVDLRIARGERLALVGANGQGKTTLVKLLTRLYEPTSGHILIDGVDIREFDIDDLHRQMGVIFQDFVRFDMSVHENIGLGQIDRLDDDTRILTAAWNSGAHEVVSKLPGGLRQMLGRRFEGGVDLSGGEWQKIALARAYMREAQILILDEPTAALDAAAEFELFSKFAALSEGRTAVLISHRFSTVKMCDRIVVIDDGTVQEQGSHAELLARGGQYAHLFNLQASQYT
jgi:ATP-binding cassette, subfamily B, bacterial